jgi:hypothetical protein
MIGDDKARDVKWLVEIEERAFFSRMSVETEQVDRHRVVVAPLELQEPCYIFILQHLWYPAAVILQASILQLPSCSFHPAVANMQLPSCNFYHTVVNLQLLPCTVSMLILSFPIRR